MGRVVHFEIHADQPERAAQFYTNCFGWTVQKWEGGPMDYWMVMTGDPSTPGINGGMIRRQGAIDGQAVIAYVCTFDIDNIDSGLEKVTSAGGTTVVPKMQIPGVGWLAYAKDTEGNIFGLWQAEPQG